MYATFTKHHRCDVLNFYDIQNADSVTTFRARLRYFGVLG